MKYLILIILLSSCSNLEKKSYEDQCQEILDENHSYCTEKTFI